jgi:predicted dehydrogenase
MINCAIVGCGNIAGGYDQPESEQVRTHAKAFNNNPKCCLVGVCDISHETVNNFSKIWNVPYATTDISHLLQHCKPDILSICTPTQTHEELLNMACSMGVPNVWLEKPVAETLSAAERMRKIAESTNTRVWVNYFRRYDAGFRELKHQLSTLGKLRHVRAIYTKGIRHNGSHMIDLILWYFGDILDVCVESVLEDKEFPSVSARLKTEEVDIYLIALNYHAYEMFEMDIIADKGRIRVVDGGQRIVYEGVAENKYYKGYKNLDINKVHTDTYEKFMEEGLNIALSNEEMPNIVNEISIQKVLERIRA